METYKKYLPKDVRINESGVPKHINKIIEDIEDVLGDFEIQKDETGDTALATSFKSVDKAYVKWVQLFRRHAKMASQSLK